MGVTVQSIDRMLATIDRTLAGIHDLPVGGPVKEQWNICWADSDRFFVNSLGERLYHSCNSPVGVGGISLCQEHYDEIADPD